MNSGCKSLLGSALCSSLKSSYTSTHNNTSFPLLPRILLTSLSKGPFHARLTPGATCPGPPGGVNRDEQGSARVLSRPMFARSRSPWRRPGVCNPARGCPLLATARTTRLGQGCGVGVA